MNPELKQKWLAALRSGNYRQGQGQLHNADNQFCCLGVLCDIVDPSRWSDRDGGESYVYLGLTCISMPAESFLSDVGLTQLVADELADLNDHGATFTEIADRIEAEL